MTHALPKLALVSLTLWLSACASLNAPATPPAAQPAAAATSAPAGPAPTAASGTGTATASLPGSATGTAARGTPTAATPPGSPPPPRPFATVIAGATATTGFFTTWQKDDKVWIELPPDAFGKPFFVSVNITNSIGDAGLYGNQMGAYLAAGRGQYLASFKRFGPYGLQMVAHNASRIAPGAKPAQHMLARSFSDSLIAQATIVSEPHPQTKAVLVEANALFVNDFPMVAGQLERTYRQNYAFDPRNSGIEKVRNSETETGFNIRAHYGLGRVAYPSGGGGPGPTPRTPATLPDVRSLFMGFYYGLSKLPEPMRPREADPRVGYFTTGVDDFTDPDRRLTRTRFINRWRLEKKDESAALSEPRQPIVYWLDKNIPVAYRAAVTAGVLEWNKSFERIGFKNAVVVKQQGDDDEIDTSATRFASIRWVAGNNVRFGARGPSKVDPRTGEILDADIEVNENITRVYSGRAAEDPPRPIGGQAIGAGLIRSGGDACLYADQKLTETAFALDLLFARGELVQGSPEAEQFVMNSVKDIIAHEVGHTLGLRHNFRGSTAITPEQLRDPEFGARNGVSASVMDYNALNIATKGERQGQYSMIALGAYDHWAIEYGYGTAAPADEAAFRKKVLAKATDPLHAYGTDEDAGYGSFAEGIDPEINRFDLSSQPLAFYEKRFAVIRELWERLQAKQLPEGTPYEQLRRNFDRGFNLMGQVTELTAKYVGGVTVLRDVAGSGRQPLTPVDAQQQRQALKLLTRHLFEVDSFQFKPEFVGKLVPDMDARFDAWDEYGGPLPGVDYSVSQRVAGLQRAALSQLLRDTVAERLVGAGEKLADPRKALGLPELYGTLQQAIWRELSGPGPISLIRRDLQREHVRLLAESVAKPSRRMPVDARSLQREFAQQLLRQLRTAAAQPGKAGHMETRAHLNESMAVLDGALKAQIAKVLN